MIQYIKNKLHILLLLSLLLLSSLLCITYQFIYLFIYMFIYLLVHSLFCLFACLFIYCSCCLVLIVCLFNLLCLLLYPSTLFVLLMYSPGSVARHRQLGLCIKCRHFWRARKKYRHVKARAGTWSHVLIRKSARAGTLAGFHGIPAGPSG